MARVAGIIIVAVLFCAWSGTGAQDTEDGSCSSFDYGEEQEKEWGECWPECNGDNQSPIDIETDNVKTKNLPNVTGPSYNQRNKPFYFSVSNDNYTVTVRLLHRRGLYLRGGPLKGRYYLDHLQFCWGSNDSMGSEHAFNGQRYPMESQWGLYSSKYASYEQALLHPGGVLRIAQMYPLETETNPSIAPIVRALPNVMEPGQEWVSDEPLEYNHIFSGNPIDDFFYYKGSLTTPPCSEPIHWFVYPPMNGVSEEQLAAFRTLQSTDGPLVNNFRSLQPLGDREVIRSDKATVCFGDCKRKHGKPAGKAHKGTKSGAHLTSGRQTAA